MQQENIGDRLSELEGKWLRGTITPEEAREYADWYNAGQGDPLNIPESFASSRAAHETRILEKINARLHQTAVISIHRRFFRHIAAAAVILFAMSGSAYLYFRRPTPYKTATVHKTNYQHDMVSGGDKAILTLGNGQQIILDSASRGLIGIQGSAKIINLEKGRLAYETGNPSNGIVVNNTVATPRGGQYQLILADGTHVWLNSASSITFPTDFTTAFREVELHGEGYFEVAKNPAHPFRVRTDKMNVEVLGTNFNLMAYTNEDAVSTTLVEGSVKVTTGTGWSLLKPGQQASLPKNGSTFSLLRVDTTEVLAWKNGKFWFKQTDIKTIMRQIARWYDVNIVYKGSIPDMELSGVFLRKEYVSQLLELLEDAGKVHFSIEGNTITVMSSEK